MKHNVILEGYGVRLRPVTLDDADFIVKLRNMPHAIGKIGDSATTTHDQQIWLEKYFERDNDYYFIIESLSCKRLGTIGIYDIDWTKKVAESGRLVILPDSLAALPSCILLIDFCFHNLKLNLLMGCVVSTNIAVIALNKQLGYSITSESSKRYINNQTVTMVNIKLSPTKWEATRTKLIKLAQKGMSLQVQ